MRRFDQKQRAQYTEFEKGRTRLRVREMGARADAQIDFKIRQFGRAAWRRCTAQIARISSRPFDHPQMATARFARQSKRSHARTNQSLH